MKKQILTTLLVVLAGTVGAATITNSITSKVNWNNPIWGSPATNPAAGNDYYYGGGVGTWLLAYGANGGFDGDSFIMPSGAAIFIKGSGAANLVLQGGQLQTRAGGTSTLTGTIRVDSTSQFLGIDGALNIATTISGSGDLKIGGFRAASNGKTAVVSGINDGYTGTFLMTQSGGDGFYYNVRFDSSFNTAGLSFSGTNPLRAPIYQLDNNITFQNASMPSLANPAALVVLTDGIYDGAALLAAGVHTNYFADNGGTIIVDSTPDVTNPIILINSATPIQTWTNWNSAIWGDPAMVPTNGNDYVNNKASVWISMLGASGSFEGDKITISAGAVVFGTGNGDFGGKFVLSGGQWQERAPVDSNSVPEVITGSMEVTSPSQILCITGGGVELQAGLSGSGNLKIGAFQHDNPQSIIFSGPDEGYTGDFILTQSGKDGVNDFAVRFETSFTGAGLTYNAPQVLRAPVYQLTNDVQFLTAKMPSQADSAVLITLVDGFYDGAALAAAGVHSAYYNDLGGRIIVGSPSYELWAEGWGVNLGVKTDNYDGDALDNLAEYGMGGDPTDPLDRGLIPTSELSGGDLVYVHVQRTDDPSLSYYLETNGNLIFGGSWANTGYSVLATNVTGGLFNFVTNSVPTAADETFVRLRVEDQ